jgi:glycogen debranching enzyme
MELLHHNDAASDARTRAAKIHSTIEREYYDKQKGCYAFSYNAERGVDRTRTVYPALAWWSQWSGAPRDSSESQTTGLEHGSECLRQFAGNALDTDWGLRDVASDEPIYDGMSYHQGSVWPLFTGWAALAEYRGGQPDAGYRLLMQNARLTRTQDLGAVTELLSGDFNVPFGRSTSHQLWSSAMVITPTLRGLFGLEIDAATKTITVNPQLPDGWTQAAIRNLQLPSGAVSITVTREGGRTDISALGLKSGWKVVESEHDNRK